jgi:transcription elongation factor SPT5
MNDEARIESDTKNVQNSIEKEFLNVKDPITSNNMDFGGKFPNRSRGGEGEYGGAAKYNGGGERTPAWGNPSRSGPFWRMRSNFLRRRQRLMHFIALFTPYP